MHFRPERTLSRKVLVRYPMALPFPLLHLRMEGVHVVQVVVFVVALPSYQLLRSTSLLLDQPVVAVGAVCPEECSAAEMVGYVLHVILRRLPHVVYLGKGRSIPGYAGKGADECRLSPLPCRSPSLLGFCIRQFLSLVGLVEVFLVQFASVRKHDVFLERLHLLHYLVPPAPGRGVGYAKFVRTFIQSLPLKRILHKHPPCRDVAEE